MNFSPQIIAGSLLYFGALLVPVFFFLSGRGQGKAKKLMWIGVGLQIFWSMVVAAIAYFFWRSGSQDALMAWGLLLPVNFVAFIYYLGVLFVRRHPDDKK